MRDPKRIPRILDAVKAEWEKYPDMRLCQLLQAVAWAAGWQDEDLYHLEDDRLEIGLFRGVRAGVE